MPAAQVVLSNGQAVFNIKPVEHTAADLATLANFFVQGGVRYAKLPPAPTMPQPPTAVTACTRLARLLPLWWSRRTACGRPLSSFRRLFEDMRHGHGHDRPASRT